MHSRTSNLKKRGQDNFLRDLRKMQIKLNFLKGAGNEKKPLQFMETPMCLMKKEYDEKKSYCKKICRFANDCKTMPEGEINKYFFKNNSGDLLNIQYIYRIFSVLKKDFLIIKSEYILKPEEVEATLDLTEKSDWVDGNLLYWENSLTLFGNRVKCK